MIAISHKNIKIFYQPSRSGDITASTMFVVKFYNPETNLIEEYLAARFAHDGLIMNTGDVMQTNWNISRLLN
jgi:hypothetical protein